MEYIIGDRIVMTEQPYVSNSDITIGSMGSIIETYPQTYLIKFDNGKIDNFVATRFTRIENYKYTYVIVNTKKEFQKAIDWYKAQVGYSEDIAPRHIPGYIRYDTSAHHGSLEQIEQNIIGHKNITEKVLGKDTGGIEKYIIGNPTNVPLDTLVYDSAVDNVYGAPDYVTQDQLDKTLLTFNQKKMQTIQEKLFEKFLNKNEKKILDAVEVSQENTERFENVRLKLSGLLAKYTTARNELTDGYNNADQKKIEEQLAKLDKFNKLFGDEMFTQLSVIRDKIEKSIDKFIN